MDFRAVFQCKFRCLVTLHAWEQCSKVCVIPIKEKNRSKLCHASLNEWQTDWMNESRKEMYRRSNRYLYVSMYTHNIHYIIDIDRQKGCIGTSKINLTKAFSSSHSQAALACFSHDVLSCSPFRLELAAVSIIITFFATSRADTMGATRNTRARVSRAC